MQDPLQQQLNQFLSDALGLELKQAQEVNQKIAQDTDCDYKPSPKLLLGLSGGLDSCVLLHMLVAAQQTIPFKSAPFNLQVMYVHHGLSHNADAWAEFCQQQCAWLNVPLQITYVNVNVNSKLGIEASARQLRYEALSNYTFECEDDLNSEASGNIGAKVQADFIVTAHHQDDQAETLLLQLFRGAGVKGLASMAAVDKPRRLLRPLLGVPRQVLHDYALQHNIQWCDDESNSDTHYERNFVRHEVMPVLATRYPAVKTVLARSASHQAEADDLLSALAALDAEHLLINGSLCMQGLAKLVHARAKNVLRWWFAKRHLAMPNAEYLTEILKQLLYAKVDANISITLQHLTLKRFQQRAYLIQVEDIQPFDLVWSGEPQLTLPNGGQLHFQPVTGAGLALKFGITRLRITHRHGGEHFKTNALRPTKTLKHLLQEANIPPWQREYLPLIYWNDTLAFVPCIGITHELQALEHELGIEITWQDASHNVLTG